MMSIDDEDYFMNLGGGGCAIHGEDFMTECGMCGLEFCTRCHPRSGLCPDCAELPDDDGEDDLLAPAVVVAEPEEDEADRLLREADTLPVEDLVVFLDEIGSPLTQEARDAR